MKSAPSSPSRPMSMTSTMFGWTSLAAARASCWKRRTCAAPSACRGRSIFSATRRSVQVCSAS